jgi:ubiquitin-protein ligase
VNPRLRRLQSDYQSVRETFSGHPHVTVQPLGDHRPPETYRITYRLRGLVLNGNHPEYRDVHTVEVLLPRGYPAEKPYCVPLTPVFHPNVREYFCIADYWAAGQTMVDVVVKVGDMIQWRIYNTKSPLDAVAARWATEQERAHPGLFPVGDVDLGVADVEISLRKTVASSAGPDEEVEVTLRRR